MNESTSVQISANFWELYDKFCDPKHLKQFIMEQKSDLAPEMRNLILEAHLQKVIHNLKRPERHWSYPKAWLAIKNVQIQNYNGDVCMEMRIGDVIAVEHNWDRDVIITHSPVTEHVCGYLLSGRWENMRGLFMPLFAGETIQECIRLRVEKNSMENLQRMKKEAKEYRW